MIIGLLIQGRGIQTTMSRFRYTAALLVLVEAASRAEAGVTSRAASSGIFDFTPKLGAICSAVAGIQAVVTCH